MQLTPTRTYTTARISRLWMAGLLFGLFGMALTACSVAAPTETRDDSFSVGDSPVLMVQGENGSVTVNPGTGDTIRVQATLHRPNGLDYTVTQDGDTIRVRAEEKGGGFLSFGDSPSADMEITAPANTRVDVATSNGRVEVHGMQQSGRVRTSNGRIVLDDVEGEFDVSTSNGSITIARAKGEFNVSTSNGAIDFSGEIVPGSDNRMTTSNGTIEVNLEGTPSVNLDASTSNGSIVSNIPVLTTSREDDRLMGVIGDGGADLMIRTSNGSVRIQ